MTGARAETNAGDPPPRANPELVGHAAAEAALYRAHQAGRLAHAWLITGPRGIGKATLAFRFARWVLSGGEAGGDLFGDAEPSLDTDPEGAVFRQVAAASHPDLLTVERGVDPKTNALRGEIVVEDARRVAHFLHLTPAQGGWRVVVIDSADEMNRHAANAVLKIVEEPPDRALVLLVSHAPARLLATIRSRCRRLPLHALSDDAVAEILARRAPEIGESDRAALARLADGSVGRALALAEAGGLDLYAELAGLLQTLPSLDVPGVHALCERLARRDAEAAYRTVTELLDWWLARLVRAGAAGGAAAPEEAAILPDDGWPALVARLAPHRDLDRWAALWEKTSGLLRRVDGARLDRKQALLNVFLALESAARA